MCNVQFLQSGTHFWGQERSIRIDTHDSPRQPKRAQDFEEIGSQKGFTASNDYPTHIIVN
jgi:hypothetical protein